jgi:hypothetical protein
MPNVIVNPIQQINVRVNQGNQQTVHSTAQFVGASDAAVDAEAALILAQSAYNAANTKLSLSGGTMTGNLIVSSPATISGIIDGGTFT